IRHNKKKHKKKLGKIIDQFRSSTDVLPDAAVVLGEHDEISWSNKLAKKILGIKKQDKNQRIQNLIRVPEFILYLKNYESSPPFNMPSPIDESIILQFRLVSYGKGQKLLIAHDVTQQKNLEAMRKDFVANVSHELRTPLTVLKGYLETLQELDDQHSPLLSQSLQQMSAQNERMEYLVDDLLLLAKLETQQKKSTFVDVNELINRICVESDAIEKFNSRIDLCLETETAIYGQEDELRSAFSNLIINALKYSPEDTFVKVIWRKTADAIIFEVIDQGEGIAAADIPRVTERFYRVDVKRSRKLSGTGLGLAIVKHVLIRHDARLEIASQVNQGSCFRCLFPLSSICNPN
ncbi:MAG: phosphate regulon sensor histidine kinase PhoR, partial [Methylococcaceae bacterium]|nr:phosphate regulon sensor histidine kinase PhoR [Methylococcaceae bacterium]